MYSVCSRGKVASLGTGAGADPVGLVNAEPMLRPNFLIHAHIHDKGHTNLISCFSSKNTFQAGLVGLLDNGNSIHVISPCQLCG